MAEIDIEKLAREAGADTTRRTIWPPTFKRTIELTPEQLRAFTAMVLEEAARRCESRVTGNPGSEDIDDEARDCAKDIRTIAEGLKP